MFGSKYFGSRYWGNRYFGNGSGPTVSEIEVDAQLLGTLRLALADTSAEGRFKELGFRPSTGLLVYALDVLDVTDISAANVPDDGHFLISAVFLEPPGNTFTDSGASAGAIGQRVVGTSGDIFVFRRPEPLTLLLYLRFGRCVDERCADVSRWLLEGVVRR